MIAYLGPFLLATPPSLSLTSPLAPSSVPRVKKVELSPRLFLFFSFDPRKKKDRPFFFAATDGYPLLWLHSASLLLSRVNRTSPQFGKVLISFPLPPTTQGSSFFLLCFTATKLEAPGLYPFNRTNCLQKQRPNWLKEAYQSR